MRNALFASLLLSLTSGCAHHQLKFNTTHQADTLNDIYRRQVLDNLAMFVDNPYAVPHFAFPNQGSSNVTDSGSLMGPLDAFRENLGFNVSRNMQEAWTLDPVRDPDKLKRMRCAYQRAVGVCCDPCHNCCEIEKGFYGSGSKKVHVWDGKHVLNSDGSMKTDPLTGAPFVDDFGLPYDNPRTGEPYKYENGCVTVPVYDCNGPCTIKCGWLQVGCMIDVPKDCHHYSGHYHGTHVWVLPEHRHHLSNLVLTILEFATKDPAAARTKQVELYVNGAGKTTTKNLAHAKVTATIPIGQPNRAVLYVGDCYKGQEGTLSELAMRWNKVEEMRKLKSFLDTKDRGEDFNQEMNEFNEKLNELELNLFSLPDDVPSTPPSPIPPRSVDRVFGPTILQERLFLDALAPR